MLVERQIKKPIVKFDLIVTEIFNVTKGKSNFEVNLKHMMESLLNNFDLNENPLGRSPGNVTNVCDGPFLLISNAAISDQIFFQCMAEVNCLGMSSGRFDCKAIDVQQCIKVLGHKGSSMSKPELLNAVAKDVSGNNCLHWCVGAKGGHPDLSTV